MWDIEVLRAQPFQREGARMKKIFIGSVGLPRGTRPKAPARHRRPGPPFNRISKGQKGWMGWGREWRGHEGRSGWMGRREKTGGQGMDHGSSRGE